MRLFFALFFFCVHVCAFAFIKEHPDSVIHRAGALADFYPDSSLFLVREIINEHDLSQLQKDRLTSTLGNAYLSLGKYDSAKYYFEKGLSSSNKAVRAQSFNGLGAVNNYVKSYDQAIENYLAGAGLLEEVGVMDQLATIYNNVGLILVKIDQQEKAKGYLFESLRLHEENKQPANTIAVLANLSNLYRTIDQLDSAAFFVQKALDQSRNLNIRYGVGKCLLMLAAVQMDMKLYENSLLNAREGSSILMEFGDSASYHRGTILEAQALAGLGALSESSLIATTLLADSLKTGGNLRSELLSLLYANSKKGGQKDTALFYLEKLREVEKVIFSSQSNDRINELEIAYETNKKENAIVTLTQQNEIQHLKLAQQRLMTTLALIGIMALIAIVLVVYFLQKRNVAEKQKEAEILRQRLLRIQLNPHFIFNAMNAIQSMILANADTEKSANQLGYFSRLTRQILELNQKEQISIAEEIQFIENYLRVQQLRFENPFKYTIRCDADINKEVVRIPPMITQPFIENAIEHGIFAKGEAGEVIVAIRKDVDVLIVNIIDNGVGFGTRSDSDHLSMSTRITRDRLALLNNRRLSSDLYFEEVPSGTSVVLKLPLIE